LEPADAHTLLANARQLERAAQTRQLGNLLRGKNLALLCETEATVEAALFRGAAEELGARVAHIYPSLSKLSSSRGLQDTARTLGRLYDAVECQELSAEIVRQIGIGAGVPVYDGVASARHPTAALAESLGTGSSRPESRLRIVQAVLMSTLL
jgi:ornithine carbamoyltransferase